MKLHKGLRVVPVTFVVLSFLGAALLAACGRSGQSVSAPTGPSTPAPDGLPEMGGEDSSGQGDTGSPKPPTEPVRIQGLIDATGLTADFVLDIRYATEDNFTGKKIYPEARFVIREETYHKLLTAAARFAEHGYKIKVWDAYRPFSTQQILWDSVIDKTWVADPSRGSNHNRGAAVDITLVDADGNELPMPSGFDEFSEKAHQTYSGCTEEEAANRALLISVMIESGFVGYRNEWWHFNDADAAQYPVMDVQFAEFGSGR